MYSEATNHINSYNKSGISNTSGHPKKKRKRKKKHIKQKQISENQSITNSRLHFDNDGGCKTHYYRHNSLPPLPLPKPPEFFIFFSTSTDVERCFCQKVVDPGICCSQYMRCRARGILVYLGTIILL